MEEFWSGVPIGIGVIISAVGLIISLRKNRTETAKGESDIKDTIVAGYESLRKALVDENKRLTDRITVLQDEVKGLRQEMAILRADLNIARLQSETAGLAKRLSVSDAENVELKRGLCAE